MKAVVRLVKSFSGPIQPASPGAAVQPLDHLLRHRAVVAEPDGPAQHEDVGGQDPLVQCRPLVGGEAVLGHVRVDAGGEVWLSCGDCLKVQLM
jgi:hypothetical protein